MPSWFFYCTVELVILYFMEIFFTLLVKLIPLYLMIFLGYIAASKLRAQKETIGKILIYIIAPIVIFSGTYTAEITVANLALPVIFFIICSCLALLFFGIGNYIYKQDSTKNILAFAAGSGNTGYFGIPVATAIFGEQAFSYMVLCILGFVLYENTLGFFLAARGNHTRAESLTKVVRLPTVYAFFIGLLLNYFQVDLGSIATTTISHFKGAYTLLGMMIIGMGLSTVKIHHIKWKFISLTFLAKFIMWPFIVLGLIILDKNILHLYSPLIYNIFVLLSIVPLAANTVTIATELNVHPDKASLAVLFSTLFALLYIPLITVLFIK